MNFLAHAWLAQPGDDGFLYGNLIADGVKGSDLSGWSPSVAGGIRHHRRVDAWVDQHSSVLLAKRRAPKTQRRYAGIALDIVWDHFIARQHAGAEQSALVERCYRLLSAWPAPPAAVDDDAGPGRARLASPLCGFRLYLPCGIGHWAAAVRR